MSVSRAVSGWGILDTNLKEEVKMLKQVVTWFVFLCLALSIRATRAEANNTGTHKGDKGLSFTVSGVSNVRVGELEGGIGGKFWISDKIATIFAIGFGADRSTTVHPSPDYSDSKRSESNFSILAGLEDHFLFRGKFSPYLGAGFRFSIGRLTYYPYLRIPTPIPGNILKEETREIAYGIRGFCGIEYFFANWISLAAQYQIDYYDSCKEYERKLVDGPGVIQPKKREQSRTTFDTGTSSLVLTFYMW